MRMTELPKIVIEKIAATDTGKGRLRILAAINPMDGNVMMYAVIRGESDALNFSTSLRTITQMFVSRIDEV